MSPLNEFQVDINLKHRKRDNDKPLSWESGWNVYSFETIKEILSEYDLECTFHKFKIPFSIPQRQDPVRTWTINTMDNNLQLTNGIKLLVDHYVIESRHK